MKLTLCPDGMRTYILKKMNPWNSGCFEFFRSFCTLRFCFPAVDPGCPGQYGPADEPGPQNGGVPSGPFTLQNAHY
jgi:hypothetical protein